MKNRFKIKLSKKTKKQIYHYLLKKLNVLLEKLTEYDDDSYFYRMALNELDFLDNLILDIQNYGG